KATLTQSAKRLEPSVGVYFSSTTKSSSISLNIPTKEQKEVIVIPNIRNSITICYDEISAIDEHCSRLITNFI
ncbi:hypothetical protein ACN09X_11680, partial [Aliarcobacter butzleri]